MKIYQKQLNKELSMLQQSNQKKEAALQDLEPKILNEKGKINWWWIVLNIGKIVGRILFAIEESKRG